MKQVHVVCALIEKDGRVFATQRGYGEFKDGWELPGGKVEPGETPKDALIREIHEELNTEIEVVAYIDTVDYDYPAFHITMDCYLCNVVYGRLELLEHEDARWLDLDHIESVDWLPPDRMLLQRFLGVNHLDTWQEWLESERLIATAFLHPWNEKECEEKCRAQAEGKIPRDLDTWGYFHHGKMLGAIETLRHQLMFEENVISVGELYMVGTLPEARGRGCVTAMMRTVLKEMRLRGDVFAILIPFSFSFYRRYGFDLVSEDMEQTADIEQFAPFSCTMHVKQVSSQEDVNILRGLYERFIFPLNFANVRSDRDWLYHEHGEFGERDFFDSDRTTYTYLFSDENDTPRGYLSFVFVTGDDGPFIGTMKIKDIVYDTPSVLLNMLGFIYSMRAKFRDVKVSFMDSTDLSLILPESDDVKRTLGGHFMARALNVDAVLRLLTQPEGYGTYTVQVTDVFMPENSGIYKVTYMDGQTESVTVDPLPSDPDAVSHADLCVTIDTFTQLAVGRADLTTALCRPGTKLNSSEAVLSQVFHRKTICLR